MPFDNTRKKPKGPYVDEFDEGSEPFPREERPQSFFSSEYANMHQGKFESPKGHEQIRGPAGGTLETLVATLAKLQFTTKGKVDADGKFELIFSSPEPVVVQTKTENPVETVHFAEPPLQEVKRSVIKYIEAPSDDESVKSVKHSRHRRKHRRSSSSSGWIRKKR